MNKVNYVTCILLRKNTYFQIIALLYTFSLKFFSWLKSNKGQSCKFWASDAISGNSRLSQIRNGKKSQFFYPCFVTTIAIFFSAGKFSRQFINHPVATFTCFALFKCPDFPLNLVTGFQIWPLEGAVFQFRITRSGFFHQSNNVGVKWNIN